MYYSIGDCGDKKITRPCSPVHMHMGIGNEKQIRCTRHWSKDSIYLKVTLFCGYQCSIFLRIGT